MVASVLSRVAILVFGILYPAYSSFKAVRRKSHRDYTKWMMYWIVFALFQTVEMVTDTFLPWLPLYYELKIVFVLWLVLPITEGSKQMYRLIIHPFLLKHEKQIDHGISKAGQTGFDTLKKISQAGLNKAATTVVSSAIKGQTVLTETLLRAQERQQRESEGVDLPHEVPPDSASEQSHNIPEGRQRPRGSSSDFEAFEVIDEGEAFRHSAASEPLKAATDLEYGATAGTQQDDLWGSQEPTNHAWSTSSSNSTDNTNNNNAVAINSSSSTGIQPFKDGTEPAEEWAFHDHQS